MTALEAKGVSHSYSGLARPVLTSFDFAMGQGEFVALMGPSGSGKSTFLHLAAGLILPTAGCIVVGDVEVTRLSDAAAARFRRRHVGVVFQSFNLVETLSVEENIALPARLDHARVDFSRVRALLDRLALSEKAKAMPSELSGGERQRVAIARALFMKPEVVLADEPTGNLDAKSAHEICRLLRDVNEEEKATILLVTHDPVVAATASRVAFLADGRLAASYETCRDPTVVSRRYLETYG